MDINNKTIKIITRFIDTPEFAVKVPALISQFEKRAIKTPKGRSKGDQQETGSSGNARAITI